MATTPRIPRKRTRAGDLLAFEEMQLMAYKAFGAPLARNGTIGTALKLCRDLNLPDQHLEPISDLVLLRIDSLDTDAHFFGDSFRG